MKIISKIILLVLFISLSPVTITHALSAEEVCIALNNQGGSENDSNSDSSKNVLAGKFVTITEEPLGKDIKEFSFRCARITECYMNEEPDEGGKTITKGIKCDPTYGSVDDKRCNLSTAEIKQRSADSKNFTTCEIIQVYVADAGPDLFYKYLGQVYGYIAQIGGLIAVFIIIFSGIQIASSGSNADVLNKAKARITRSIMGLILLFMTAVILYLINPNFFVIS